MAKSDKCFTIQIRNDLNKYSMNKDFNYLIYIGRCDNINKLNLIKNNLFNEDFLDDYIYDEYKMELHNINFNGENIHYNLHYYNKTIMTDIHYNGDNIDDWEMTTALDYRYKYNIINETFTTKSEHTLTLEEYVRKIADFLLNIPELKVYVLLPNLNVVEYSSELPCSTWTDSYLLIKYYDKNISRFEPIFENILKSYYIQDLTKTIDSIYKNNYYLGTNLSNVRNDIKTFYQNDDDYWNGKLKINQKPEIEEIEYSLDPILIKYKSKIEEQEKLINELRNKEHEHKILLQQQFNKSLNEQIETIKKDYSIQLSNIQSAFENKIQSLTEENIKLMNENETNNSLSIDESTKIKLQSENRELTSQNELLISQFNGMKSKINELNNNLKSLNSENTELKSRLLKQDNIIKKLTSY